MDTAINDIAEGKEFYNSKDLGWGDYFSECIFTEIKALKFRFGLHRKEYGFHRMLFKTFAYAAYYEHVCDVYRIVAVLDMRKNPKTRELLLEYRKGKERL